MTSMLCACARVQVNMVCVQASVRFVILAHGLDVVRVCVHAREHMVGSVCVL